MLNPIEEGYRKPIFLSSDLQIHIIDMGRKGLDELQIDLPTRDMEHFIRSSRYDETMKELRKGYSSYQIDVVCCMPSEAMRTTAVDKKYFLRIRKK